MKWSEATCCLALIGACALLFSQCVQCARENQKQSHELYMERARKGVQ